MDYCFSVRNEVYEVKKLKVFKNFEFNDYFRREITKAIAEELNITSDNSLEIIYNNIDKWWQNGDTFSIEFPPREKFIMGKIWTLTPISNNV